MAMSKKHFVRMADVVSEIMVAVNYGLEGRQVAARIAREFADMAKADNGAFDRQKFYAACGLDNNGRAS